MAKEAYYFSHDSNARRDPKILAMRNEYGSEGYGWYWMIVEMLSEQEDYKLEHKKWVSHAIAMELLCDANSAENFVNSCINDYELFQSDGDYFWAESLVRRMNIKEEKRKKRSEAGKKGAQKRWNDSDQKQDYGNDMAMPMQTHDEAMAKDGKGKERKGNESKENKIRHLDYVLLTEAEYTRLINDYGKKVVDSKIEDLDNYIGSKGKRYKDHNKTLRAWLKKDVPLIKDTVPKKSKEQIEHEKMLQEMGYFN